ncbi:hypothetical protein E0K89_001175 [Aquicoccus sp. SCR17]|nr:hypothetical protein [Carideicomes alvinocaridis]
MERHDDDDRGYEVGYGKPPRHTRFRKGRSGNPRGRPRGVKNAGTILRDILYRKVTITEDGQRKRITAIEAFFLREIKEALTGNSRSGDRILKLLPLVQEQMERDAAVADAEQAENARDDGPILAAFAGIMGVSASELFLEAQMEGDDGG